jgi:PAS domain-containing protein
LSVPVELDGGVIGTLDIYAREARDWDPSEVAALQAYAGLVASLLSAAVAAQGKGRLADQLEAALEHRWLIEQAKGVLMGRERLDAQAAFERLRGAARSSTRRLADVAKDVTDGEPLPADRPTQAGQGPGQPRLTGEGNVDRANDGACSLVCYPRPYLIERGRSVLAVVTSHVLRSYARRLPGAGRPRAVWHLRRPTNPERSVVRTCLPPRPLPPPHRERPSPSSASPRP